jgi:hypothetical protein
MVQIKALHKNETYILFTVSKDQKMHYIIKYCSISPTYVSAPAEPSSGGQGYIHITSIS